MEKINFINNSEPAINDTNLNKLQDNVETAIKEAGVATIYEFEIPMSSMELVPTGTAYVQTFSQEGNFAGGIIIGLSYKKGNGVNRFTPGHDAYDEHYKVQADLIDSATIGGIQGRLWVSKTMYDEDMAFQYLTDKTYYVQVAVLKK